MNNTSSELTLRVDWAIALIANLVEIGRRGGWLAGAPSESAPSEAALTRPEASIGSPMRTIATRLGLSELELDVLWLLACVELDPCVARATQLLLFPGMQQLSIQTVERLLGRGAALSVDVFANLARLALLDIGTEGGLHRRPVTVHDRVVDLARGQLALDRTLRDVASLDCALSIRRQMQDCTVEIPDELRAALVEDDRALFVATGIAGAGRSTLLRHAISGCGRTVMTINTQELSQNEGELAQQLCAIGRECAIHDAWPLFVDVDCLSSRFPIFERVFLAHVEAPVFCTATEMGTWSTQRPIVPVPVGVADASARESIWQQLLADADHSVVRECAQRYVVSPGVIVKAASAASALAGGPESVEVAHVHRALRTHLERQLRGIARRIETKQSWDDLVLPIEQFDLLVELVARVRHKKCVLDQWGFADKVGRGLGLSALFSGPPGTGKTMIAGLVANELGLDLYQVDLSKVVSKYIGETEKQLGALFEAAESGHAILLFDEADSLFAKRTEVKSSNDRYANLEVNYLLQRLEAFSGITILTTNHETAIDEAFKRRLAFHVRVPMPDEQHRELIWSSMIPAKAQRADDLDFTQLASEFVMSGGYIKNAVLRAAFMAADAGSPITNELLMRAARAEYEAMGKVAFQATRLVG